MRSPNEYEQLIDSLVEGEDTFSHSGEFTDSSILEVKRELSALQERLRQPAPADEFEEESACEQVLELVEAIGRDPSFSTRQLAAARPTAINEDPLPGGGVLGQYRLLMKLGEGGFGSVYKALHSRLDKVVALKVLTPSRLQNPQAVSRFSREMRAVGKLHHVNIVAAHDAGEVDGMHYLVMELVDGIDLRALVKQRGRLPIGAACELIRQAALGLQHAHEHGLVHRDIKPSNLMLTLPRNHDEAPSLKVLDLGLALLDEDHLDNFGELTATGQVMGTLEYMAPEQGADTHSVDIRADIYSLGASLYKLLTGKAPFPSDQYRSPIKLLMALAVQEPPPLGERCPEIPPDLEAIVQRMLSKKPADRFATPRELAEALTPFSQPQDLRALVDFLTTTADEPVDVNAPSFIGTKATESRSRTLPQEMAPETTTYIAARPRVRAGGWRWTSRIALALIACGILIAAAMYVIEVRTSRGTLIVQSDYPGIQVKIKRDGKELVDGWSLLKGEDNKQVISTGDIEIELPAELKGEYTVTPNRVTLTKDKQEVVKIERRDASRHANDDEHKIVPPAGIAGTNPVPTTPAVAEVDRDHLAAEWLVNLGGSGVAIHELTEQTLRIDPAVALPDVRFKLTSVSLNPHHLVDIDDLKHLAGLTKLRHLSIRKKSDRDKPMILDDLQINLIAQIPRLQTLSIAQCQVKTSTLKALHKLPLLRSISINSKQVDDDWQFVKELQHLRTIDINDDYVPIPTDYDKWGKFSQLRRITVNVDKRLDPEITKPLFKQNPLCQAVLSLPPAEVHGLRETVVLGFNPVRAGTMSLLDRGFRLTTEPYFGSRGELTKEIFAQKQDTNPQAINAVRIPQEWTQGGPTGLLKLSLPGFAQIPMVRLDANGLRRADDFVAILPQSTVVEDIYLKDSDLTSVGLRKLQRIDPFVNLYLQGTKVKKSGIEAFLKARPACTIHTDFGVFEGTLPADSQSKAPAVTEPERAAAAIWQRFDGEGTLRLIESGKLVEFGPASPLPDQPFQLQSLSDAKLKAFTNDDLEPFTNLTGLESLHLNGADIDASAVQYLKQMPSLVNLNLSGTLIRSSALVELKDLPHLQRLGVSGQMVDDNFRFLSQLKETFRFDISNYQPTAADWQQLRKISHLRSIAFSETKLEPSAVAEFQRMNPVCQVMVGETPRITGIDPMREAVRQLAARDIGFNLRVASDISEGSTVQEVLANPARFHVKTLYFHVPTGRSEITQEVLSPVRAIWYDTLLIRPGAISADEFVAALPDDIRGQRIDLADTNLTDQGLLRLAVIARPITLDIRRTQVTWKGIKTFLKVRPACTIRSDFGDIQEAFSTNNPSFRVEQSLPDHDRLAAQDWLDHGGRVTVVLKNGRKAIQISPGDRLPVTPFEFRAADPTENTLNSHLERLVDLQNLQRIKLNSSKVDSRAFEYLSQVPHLRNFKFALTQISPPELGVLRELPFLHEIEINHNGVYDDWKFLGDLPHLRTLVVANYRSAYLNDFIRWSEFPQLRTIRVEAKVPDEMVARLHQKNPLCRVIAEKGQAKGWKPGDPVMRSELAVVGPDPVRTAAQALLSQGFRLSTSDLWEAGQELSLLSVRDQRLKTPWDVVRVWVPPEGQFTKQFLSPLGNFHFLALDAFELRNADVFTNCLPVSLAVDEIDLSHSDLTDQGLTHLQHLEPFPVLKVLGTSVTQDGIATFKKVRPACHVISNFDRSQEIAAAHELPRTSVPIPVPQDPDRAAVELWQQRLGSGLVFTAGAPGSANFDPFTKLPDGGIQFVLAHGTNVKGLSNEDLKVFANLGGLKFLEPTGPEIDVGAISYLRQIPTLIDLDPRGTRIPTSAIAELGSHLHLINLGVAGKMVDDQWKFLNYLSQLRCLRIHDLQPTAEDWRHLQVGRRLRQLHFMSDVELAPADVASFQQSNPFCRVMVGYPKKRSIGNDPQREAVRQLAAKDMGMNISIGEPLRASVGQVLADPFPFYVDFIHLKLPKEATIEADSLKPLQAILFNEFRVLWEGGNTDEFVANLPDELAAQRINFTGCDLTDKGLQRMHQISPPSILDIRATKVTREGVMAYQKAFPTCKVLSDP